MGLWVAWYVFLQWSGSSVLEHLSAIRITRQLLNSFFFKKKKILFVYFIVLAQNVSSNGSQWLPVHIFSPTTSMKINFTFFTFQESREFQCKKYFILHFLEYLKELFSAENKKHLPKCALVPKTLASQVQVFISLRE